MLVCDSGSCKDSQTYLYRYMGNEAGGQAYGAEEAATAQEQLPFIAAQLWAFLACSGERGCRCLVEVDVLLSILPQEVPTMPPAHHCSSPNSSSGTLPLWAK